MIFPNPVPTAGEVRSAWSRNQQTLQPVFGVLRVGVHLGLGLAGMGVRASRDNPDRGDRPVGSVSSAAALTELGERTAREILAVPAVSRTTGRAHRVGGVLTSRAGRVVDEAHDTVEEAYGRFYQGLDRLRQALLPAMLRQPWN